MQNQILYTPDQIELDLSRPDLGHPDGLEILKRHYRQSKHPNMGYSKARPAFVCLEHEGGENPGLYLKKLNGEWWAVRYESGACASKRLPAPMSDEHKRQTEYWARAAQDAGYRVEVEHNLHTGTRPDALIHGPVKTGIEVQRSSMTAVRAVERTGKAEGAGVTDVWFSGKSSDPPWAWRVPTVLPRELGIDRPQEDGTWMVLPPRRAVAAAGLRVIRALKCAVGNLDRCPYGRNWCGRYHPRPAPWGRLAVDDVAAMVPAGEIVTLRFYGVRMLVSKFYDAIFLVSPDHLKLYEELTGWSGHASFRPEAEDRTRKPSAGAECRNVQPPGQRVMASPGQTPKHRGIWGTDPHTPMWCETCEQRHPVIEHRDCRADA
jgi:hypothetical protein